MDWAARLAFHPRNFLLLASYGAVLVAIGPALRTRQQFLLPLLVGIAAAGTLVYARFGLLVLTAPCERCGERSYVGALWCCRLDTVRTAVARPLVQAATALALFVIVGWVASTVRVFALWIAIEDGFVRRYLQSDDAIFRAYFLATAMVASVPMPVLVGNLLRFAAGNRR